MEAINIFLKKEQEDKMFDREVNNIKYWEYVRPLTSCCANSIVSGGSPMFSKNKFNIHKFFINPRYLKKYFLCKKQQDILFISQPRRILSEGKYKNNYIDYYIDYLKDDYKIITLEEPTWSSLGISKNAHDFPLYTDNIYLTDIHELHFLIRKKLYKLFHYKNYQNIENEYKQIHDIVNSWYENSHEDIDFKNSFINTLIRIDIDRKFIKKILKKVNPKIVLLHYMPSDFKEMFINECNNQNITTVEVQHGTITKVDPLVNKCLDISVLNNTTDYIFSFGENQIHKYALSIKNIDNVINIGFPFFEEKLKNIQEKEKKYIYVISQSTIGDDMAEFTSKLADLIKDSKYKIIFKYHPNELSKDYKCLKKDNIIEIKTEMTSYDIQSEAILQIGSYSTALYEGFAMKVPTLVVESMFGAIETVDIFNNIKKGVYFIDKPEDVLKYIDKDDIIPENSDINMLWQKDSKKILKKTIKNIIGR